jgi:subtilisin family serine protease
MSTPTNRYAVTFKENSLDLTEASERLNVNTARVKDAMGTLLAAPIVDTTDVLHFPQLGVSYLELTEEQARSLSERADVLQVRLARTVSSRPLLPPTMKDSFAPQAALAAGEVEEVTPNVSLVKANEVWSRVTGAGVKVGIIDSGIDRSHPDLSVVDGASFFPGIFDWDDVEDGHGTACAGIVGARRNNHGIVGVAPDCDLYALKVSQGGRSNTDFILAAMVWAAERRLDVVSISLWDDDGASAPDEPEWLDMARGSELLLNSGCLVVGIAGNSGDLIPNHWITNPGRVEGFMAVGSVNHDRTWSPFSSFGPEDLGENRSVEIAAPGANVRSAWRGGIYADGLNGTSFACPHVTGAAALLKQLHPTWSPQEIRVRLKQTADDITVPGRDEKTGWGLLNCHRAVNDPVSPNRVYNEISGRVTSLSRQGDAHVVRFSGDVVLRDWNSERVVADVIFIVSPPVGEADASLLGAAIGRQLTLFGLFLDDATDTRLFRASQLGSLTITE